MNRKQAKNRTIIVDEVEVQMTEGTKRKQIGLLGGNFNPVHYAHLIIADQVASQLGLDQVLLMPTFEPPHIDAKQTIAANYRLDMLEIAIAGNDVLGIEQAEIERKGKSYTYDTIKFLQEKNPDNDYYFIIGGDMVEYLPKWYKIDELSKMIQFVGIKRPQFLMETNYPVIWIDIPLMDISSSVIRKKIQQQCSVRYLLPQNVINYIQEKRLYQNDGA